MIGIVFILIALIGVFVESCKKDSYNAEKRNNAKLQGKPYYMDYNGNDRRVDNNHEVLRNMHDWSNGDRVDIDVKTGEYLNRVPNEKRVRRENWIKKCEEDAKRRKKEAIEKGQPFYYATVQIDDVSKYRSLPGSEIYLRVSDDLPLDKEYPIQKVSYKDETTGILSCKDAVVMRDYNLGFYVGTEKDYDEKDYEFIERWKEYNWGTINYHLLTGKASSGYIYNNGFFEKMDYDTPEKKEAYARKIGAFL